MDRGLSVLDSFTLGTLFLFAKPFLRASPGSVAFFFKL